MSETPSSTPAPRRLRDRLWQIAGWLALLILLGGGGWLFSRPFTRPFQADFALEEGFRHYRNERYAEAVEAFDRALTLEPDHGAAYFNRGLSYAALASYDRALDDLNQTLVLYPDYPWAYFERGQVWMVLGDAAAAYQDFDQAVTLKPYYAEFYLARARAADALGDVPAACADFTAFLDLYDGRDAESELALSRREALHCVP